jgi:hypothetical protein
MIGTLIKVCYDTNGKLTKIGAMMAETKSTKPVAVPIHDIDEVPVSRYPRSDQTEHYRAEVLAPMTGIPTVRIAPVGWVGPVPLQIPESRIDELIELLKRIR